MADDSKNPRDEHGRELPTTDKPLHGERRPVWPAVLATLALVVGLVAFYLFGLDVLVPSD